MWWSSLNGLRGRRGNAMRRPCYWGRQPPSARTRNHPRQHNRRVRRTIRNAEVNTVRIRGIHAARADHAVTLGTSPSSRTLRLLTAYPQVAQYTQRTGCRSLRRPWVGRRRLRSCDHSRTAGAAYWTGGGLQVGKKRLHVLGVGDLRRDHQRHAVEVGDRVEPPAFDDSPRRRPRGRSASRDDR